jgi:hypothetical protein
VLSLCLSGDEHGGEAGAVRMTVWGVSWAGPGLVLGLMEHGGGARGGVRGEEACE